MVRTANAAATGMHDPRSNSASTARWKRLVFAFLLCGVLGCLPARGYAAGLDCPEIGSGAVPNLLAKLQVTLVASGNTVDLVNEINDLIYKLQIEKPDISYTELTNVAVAAYCPMVANMRDLTASEKWRRLREFDTILQHQLAVNMMPPGSLIIANVPLPPAVYRELRSRAVSVGQSPAQLMGAILSRAAEH
jgi:hypothetical protein